MARTPALSPLRLLLLCLFAVGLVPAAQAQFSGPALAAPTTVRPVSLPTTDTTILYPGTRDVHVVGGDTLTIHLYGSTDYDTVARVAEDGSVQLPLIGVVQLGGLSVTQAEQLIDKRLLDAGMYKNPQISIRLTEAPDQFVTVTGEMHAIVPVVGQRYLYDILAAAGGGTGTLGGATSIYGVASGGGSTGGGTLPPTASHIITIIRPGVAKPIVVDLGTDPEDAARANIPVYPRDTIVISRIGVVYVVGAFKTQGAIPLVQNSPLTLMQVAALSGGIGFEARHDDLRIVRTVGLDRKVIKVDISAVLNGKAPDPVMQADDILYLPSNAVKAAIKSGGLGTVLGLASVLSYAILNH
jgi:polysaccharide export outer membrane protein